jgi:hypothetical protein
MRCSDGRLRMDEHLTVLCFQCDVKLRVRNETHIPQRVYLARVQLPLQRDGTYGSQTDLPEVRTRVTRGLGVCHCSQSELVKRDSRREDASISSK